MRLTATKVAQQLGVSNRTLLNWYAWYLNDDIKKEGSIPELPMYEVINNAGTRVWKEEDIPKLVKFKEWVPKGRAGIMGAHNSQYWGKERRERALQNKQKALQNG